MSGRAHIAPGDARALLELKVDALVLPLYQLRVQPRAAAGHADWRLGGRIARLLVNKRFEGRSGEALLMPGRQHLGVDRVFLFGLGTPWNVPASNFELITRALVDARVRSLAFGSPKPPAGVQAVSEAQAAVNFLEAAVSVDARFEEVVLLEVDQALSAAHRELARAARRAGLLWQS